MLLLTVLSSACAARIQHQSQDIYLAQRSLWVHVEATISFDRPGRVIKLVRRFSTPASGELVCTRLIQTESPRCASESFQPNPSDKRDLRREYIESFTYGKDGRPARYQIVSYAIGTWSRRRLIRARGHWEYRGKEIYRVDDASPNIRSEDGERIEWLESMARGAALPTLPLPY